MTDAKTCFMQRVKQDKSKSLSEFLNKKNPLLPELEELFTNVKFDEKTRGILAEVFGYFFDENKNALNFLKVKHYFDDECIKNVENIFIDKILAGKISNFDKARKTKISNLDKTRETTLNAFIRGILKNISWDEHKKRDKNKKRKDSYLENKTIELKKTYVAEKKNDDIPDQNISFTKKTILAISGIGQRITIKMWVPYVFGYEFDSIEERFLEEKKLSISDIKKTLEKEIDKTQGNNKYYVPIQFIADILDEKCDVIYKRIERFKKQLKNREQLQS